ncbi:MAG: Gfo/Idh/MocA family oxidoreductase [Planctomycetes bacterium]|nr:Gfo/Idh/MocA family oxidoreductase [Planctomycetota bacterium]
MSANGKLRAVQIGCGGRAQTHMDSMIKSGAIDLVAICDIDEPKLKAAAEKFKVAKTYKNMEEMIQKEKPEFVDICTPPTIRTSIVEPAIKAGAPAILIEKPIALTPSESRKLAELGKSRLIAVNTQYQWMPHWQRFWGMLKEKALGEIRYIRCSTRANILEQGPHVLDLSMKAARISGLPEPEWVLGNAHGIERFGKFPVPSDTSATAGLGPARLFMNFGDVAPDVPGETVKWYHIQVDIVGSKGRIWVTLNQGWTLWLDGKFETGSTAWPRDDGLSQCAMYADIRDHLKQNRWKEFPTRVELASINSDLMMAVYASALGGGKVKLPQDFSDDLVNKLEGLPK